MSLANMSSAYKAMLVRVSNLSSAYKVARLHTQPPGEQQQQIEELLAQWFIDSNEGARTFLRELALEYREHHPLEHAAQHGIARDQPAAATAIWGDRA